VCIGAPIVAHAARPYRGAVAGGDDDWAVLGVAPGTPLDVVRRAYLHRAQRVHPDRHPDADPTERARLVAAMAELNVAWERIERGRGAARAPVGERPSARTAFPDGFVASPLRRAPGHEAGSPLWALRLWTDDLQPLHHLAAGPAAGAVGGLDLRRRPVTDRHLPLVARLPRLAALDLSDTGVTGAGLPALAGLHLATLDLRGSRVGGDALDLLASWPALRLLALPHVDRAARHRFAERRPDVTLT
jgi:hypothetical protein